MNHRLSLENIQEAARIIDPVFLNSPQFIYEPLSQALGTRLVLKIETANPLRSFKGRGADYTVAGIESGSSVICASAGNFGQAMAYACRKRGIDLTVYASVNANPFKLQRMRELGASLVLHGEDFDAAKLEAKKVASRLGVRLVEDSLEPRTGEGAGTMGLELSKFPDKIDAVLIALGNGAMVCGVARWLKHVSPSTRIIAVQAQGAPAMVESWKQGQVVEFNTISTIADGIGIRLPIPEAVEDMQGLVDEALLVKDETLIKGMRLAHRHLGLVLEPSGAAGLAALIENPASFKGQTVATILCGGNLTPEQMQTWLNNPER